MNGLGLDEDLGIWFKFKTARTTIPKRFILRSLEDKSIPYRHYISLVWLGQVPDIQIAQENKKEIGLIECYNKKNNFTLTLELKVATWLVKTLEQCHFQQKESVLFSAIEPSFKAEVSENFEQFWKTPLGHRRGQERSKQATEGEQEKRNSKNNEN